MSKVWDRAKKLAGLARAEGPEGVSAARLLRQLVEQHPELSPWLNDGATECVRVEVQAHGRAEVALLLAVTAQHPVALQIEDVPGGHVSLGRHYVAGPAACVRVCLDEYRGHRGVLLCLETTLVEHYLERALPEAPDEHDSTRQADDDGDASAIPAHVLAMAEDYELAGKVMQGLDSRKLSQAITGLVDVVVLPPEPAALLLDGQRKHWDSPELTAEDLWVLYRQLRPSGKLERWWVRQRHELGWRLHPVTLRWRRFPKLATNPPWDE